MELISFGNVQEIMIKQIIYIVIILLIHLYKIYIIKDLFEIR